MVALRGFIASCLLASAVASPHLTSTEVSGPRIEKTRGLEGIDIHRDSHIFPRSPGAPMVRRNGLAALSKSKKFSFEQTLENQVIFNRYVPLTPA
ncbi:hypothetical protein IMZ48_47245 [Candidatus Bathyarchaeota archaeon]|nr:hypothetical protein [Candidatus Bathyarchaeota archaeon]